MEKRYQHKIEYLQKFVPFLSKLIERLKTESDSEAKVVQLQLFYNLLICPDPSVTIEDLEKCEEALINFYKSYHSDSDGPLIVGEEVNKISDVEIDKNLMDTTTKMNSSKPKLKCSSEHSSNDEKYTETANSKDVKESNDNIKEKDSIQENYKGNTEDECKIEDNELKKMEKREEENEMGNKEQVKIFDDNEEKSRKEENTSSHREREVNDIQENEVHEEEDSHKGENANSDKEEIFEETKTYTEKEVSNIIKKIGDKPAASADKAIESSNSMKGNVKENALDQNNEEIEQIKNQNTENKTANIDFVESDNADDDELEENVELVKMPEAESEEMILPDSEGEELKATVEHEEHESNASETDEPELEIDEDAEHTEEESLLDEKTNEDEEAEQTEDEPLLVAIETASDVKVDEDGTGDPLNVDGSVNKAEDKEVADVTAAAIEENINKNYDDDDDDVQVIETRNSPICIDSDDDVPLLTPPPVSIRKSERNKSISKVTAITPTPTTKTKVKTRNSKPIDRSINRFIELIEPKDCPPRKYIDLIELLDSSDDDDTSTAKKKNTKFAPKLPMKRCLLPKPIRPTESMSNSALRQPDKFIAYPPPKPPTQVHISTPQSNFLNAVNLQPANTSNPPAFSTQLSNKNIIIPNAFYGNPPEARGTEKDKSLRKSQQNKNPSDSKSAAIIATASRVSATKSRKLNYKGWLENFITNFASPQQKASNSCLVILQRVLKYKFFQKIRDVRVSLDAMAQKPNSFNLDVELMRELRRIFFVADSTELSEVGIKFCEFATNQTFGRTIALTTDMNTGRISSKTRHECEVFEETATASNFLNGFLNATPPMSTTIVGADSKRKKQKDYDEQDEYTPTNPINENELIGERKRSLRTNRVKRVDNSFSYNEDHEDTDDEEDDSYAAVKRKVEQKRQEAKKQCEQMAKSFESAFIQTFAKNITDPDHTTVIASATYTTNGSESKRQRLSVPSYFKSPTVHTDLTLDEDSLDEGLKQHRIYKVLPEKLISVSSLTPILQKQRNMRNIKAQQNIEPEVITCSDDGSDDEHVFIEIPHPKSAPKSAPKNTNQSLHAMNKGHDKCVICKRVFQRIVHHYINEHQGCEVYTSRLTKAQVTQLRQNKGNLALQSIYKNGQNQYEGTCAFCQRRSRFMLSYWYQHYSMHTGEYAYRCSGCGTRKPTRSLLQAHVNAPCKKRGRIIQDYKFDSKAAQIEARVCAICNYIQLNRSNVVQHLRTQHNVKEVLPKHITTIVLLKWNPTLGVASTITTVKDSEGAIYEIEELDSGSASGNYADCSVIHSDGIIDGVGNTIDNNEMYYDFYGENSAAQFNYDAGDPSDDLSFMICGMLDVQMDTE